MKNLYIHVGCGKTGSSALQVWLSQITEDLKKQGVLYPMHNRKPLGDYAISSGNGVNFYKAVKGKFLDRYYQNLNPGEQFHSLLYSSEIFQNLNEEESEYLLNFAKAQQLEVQVIAYVRDVYDTAYSSFQQLVKRHTYYRPFTDFALSRKSLQQFSVVRKFSQWFENLHVIHYDTLEDRDVSSPLMQVVGLDPSGVPRMENRKVNRSLTIYETELMLLANRIYMEKFGEQSKRFSASLSDKLIAICPELDTEILFDKQAFKHFEKVMSPHIDFINSRFFGDARLKVFRPEGKSIVQEISQPPEDVKRFVTVLVNRELSESRSEKWIKKWAKKLFRK